MVDPSTIYTTWDSVYAISKPLGLIGASLAGISFTAWTVVQFIKKNNSLFRRDEELNRDYSMLRLDNEALQTRYNLLLARSQALEAHVRFLAQSIVSMTENVKALSSIITSLVTDNKQNKPLLILVANTAESFERIKAEAEKMIGEARKELEAMRELAANQQEELNNVQRGNATRRDANEE
jgi:NhaP-type Na+/H+ and K+/H+ antiporter